MTALRLAETSRLASVTLVDIVPGLAAGLALDMWHSAGLRGFTTRISGSTEIAASRRRGLRRRHCGQASRARDEPHRPDRRQR